MDEQTNPSELLKPEQWQLLTELLLKRDKAQMRMDKLKKGFAGLKTKVKRFEKRLAALNEEKSRSLILTATQTMQLAINKYVPIEKKTDLCKAALKTLDKMLKDMQSALVNPYHIPWTFEQISYWHHNFTDAMTIAENELRIAKDHLKKIDSHATFLRSMNALPIEWRQV